MSEYLQKIVYLTESQYAALANGETVGNQTGLNDNYIYMTDSKISLTDIDPSFILPVNRGGTGATSWASGKILVGNGSNTFTTIDKATANTANTLVQRDGSGNFSAGTITAALSGNATSATKTGIASIWLYPEYNNELNFGGNNAGSNTIYFGYRAKDSKAIPTKFVFGSSNGTADLQAKTIYLGSGTSSYISSTQYTGNATSASYLKLYEARATTTSLNKAANYVTVGAMFHLIASSSTSATDNGKTPTDANILQMNWDSNGGYDAQIGVSTAANRMFFRDQPSNKKEWQEVAHATVSSADTGSDVKPVYMTSSGVITPTTNEMIQGFLKSTTSSAHVDLNTLYDSGFYSIPGGYIDNAPTGSSAYANIITAAYRKPSGNTNSDYAWQIGNFTQNNDRLWYRTSQASSWRAWRQIVNIATNTAVGNSTTPVYVDANGAVQLCTSYANASVNYATSAGAATTATSLTNFVVSTYTLPAETGVRIEYPTYDLILISAQLGKSSGQLILIGGGYGAGGTTRNGFTEVVSPREDRIAWSLPQSDSIYHSIEIMNLQNSNATITVWAKETCTFTEITALTTPATNRTLLHSKNTTAPSTVPTLAWNTESTIFTLNGNEVKIKAMSSPTWSEVQSKPATATRWPKWNEIGEGSDALLTQGTSEVTASTEILTSYATNNGFSDSNAPGRVYRRAASKVVNATLVKAALGTGSGTAKFLREDGTWSNIIKQASTAALGIDTGLKIGTAIKDLHFSLGSGSGTDINSGNAGGITFGTDSASYGGIYWQTSGAYGSRLHFATTNSFANGAYTRMIITSTGYIGIGTLSPDTLLTVNGNAKATKFIGNLEGNATGTASNVTGTVAIDHGGTGTTTAPTQGGIIYASSTSAYASTTAGNANQVLVSNGTSAPSWRNDRGIEYIRGMWTSASGTWTGTTQDAALYEGKQIILFMPFGGSGNATLNLTLNGAAVGASGSTTTGAKNVYYEGTSRFTTHKGQYSQIHLIYHENHNINGTNYTGWWYLANRDTNDGQYYLRQYTIKAQSAITTKHIIGGTDSGYNNVDSTAFDIRYAVLYCGTSLSAGSTGYNNYLFNYAINIQNSANSNISLTAYKNVYIKGTISGNMFTPISGGSPYVQDITAADDGYCYYYIGRAYDTAALTFDSTAKAIYWYKNGGIQPYTSYAASTASVALSDVTGADDVQAIEALTGTTGFLKKTAANTWTLDTSTYLTSHFTSHLYVNATSGGAASDAATTNTTTYIHLYDDSTKRDTIQIKGSGGTVVSATNGKVITIKSFNDNVLQAADTATTSWRKILLSTGVSTTPQGGGATNGTSGVSFTPNVSVQPSTGILCATAYNISEHVSLEYNSTDQSLDFVFI